MPLLFLHNFVFLFVYLKNSSYLCTRLGAGNKQANRKIMVDIEKLHHSQDLARARTKNFNSLDN